MATYDFTVRAEDETGAFADRTFSIEVKNDLVERFVAVDNNHAYSSVDGVNWTTRTGQGGHTVKRVGNYWIVGNNNGYPSILGNQIRLSFDAVNWTQKTLPSSHTSANSFHFINGWYYFLGTAATTLHNTIWKTQDFIDYSVVYESPFVGANSGYNIREFPANMLYSNSEFIFFDRINNGATKGQQIDIEKSAIVRFNINTEDNIRHAVSQFILPSGSTGITTSLVSCSIHKVNDAFVIYGMDNYGSSQAAFTIPHYTFDFINYNISNNNFASEVSLVNKTDYLYHNGNVIVGYRGASFHKTKDLQNYSKLYPNAVFYPRDILSYKGYIYSIPSTTVTGKFTLGKLYKGTIEDYESGTLQNVSENDPILAPTNLNSVAVIK